VIDWPASLSGKNALGLATMFGSGMVARPKRLGSSTQKKDACAWHDCQAQAPGSKIKLKNIQK